MTTPVPSAAFSTLSLVARPEVTENDVLITFPGVVDTVDPVAVSVYPTPALSIVMPLNVARPVVWLTETLFVPRSVPPGPALFCMASVTVCATPLTEFPNASWSVTTGWTAKAIPALPPPGLVVNASLFAAPGVIVNTLLSTSVRPALDDVSFLSVPTRFSMRFVNVARPLASVGRTRVPVSVPVPDVSAMETEIPDVRTLFPSASFT